MFKPKFFNRFSAFSVWSIVILFFLGGLVRTTGSGMGCPDWPKCFGVWIPPTSADELPEGYEQDYLKERKEKVHKLANTLDNIGWAIKAKALRENSVSMEAHAFNARKTYTEYINRLWGALTGIITLLASVSSLQFIRKQSVITILTGLGLLFVLFNAWLGSVVVDTDLLGGVVTLHFVLAFIAVAFFLLANTWNKKAEGNSSKTITVLIGAGLVLSVLQLITGTGVRELVDSASKVGSEISMANYMEILGVTFNIHRVLALVSGVVVVIAYLQNRSKTNRPFTSLLLLLMIGVLIVQALSGISNIRFGFPVMAQLIHVTLGSLTVVGFIYLMIFEIKSNRRHVN